jgi:hypothetical protein
MSMENDVSHKRDYMTRRLSLQRFDYKMSGSKKGEWGGHLNNTKGNIFSHWRTTWTAFEWYKADNYAN